MFSRWAVSCFTEVTPFSGGITFKMWTRLFHSTHDSLRFLSSPARTVRGSLTPRRGIHTTTHMTPVRRPLSGSTFRMAFTPVATRQRTSTHMTPSAPQKSSQGSRTPVNHGRHTSRSSKKLLYPSRIMQHIKQKKSRTQFELGPATFSLKMFFQLQGLPLHTLGWNHLQTDGSNQLHHLSYDLSTYITKYPSIG